VLPCVSAPKAHQHLLSSQMLLDLATSDNMAVQERTLQRIVYLSRFLADKPTVEVRSQAPSSQATSPISLHSFGSRQLSPCGGCCPALAAAVSTARQSPDSPGMQPWALGASGLWHQLPALTLSALLPPSPRPGTALEETPTALSATGTSRSRSWDGCWDVSSSSNLPVKPQPLWLQTLFVSSNNSWRIKRVRQVGAGFIPQHTDTS